MIARVYQAFVANVIPLRPMSQISSIFGTDDDDEILTSLYLIANVSGTAPTASRQVLTMSAQNTDGLGLIHESIDIYNTSSYTRPWFAWVNSYFSEMLLDLAQRKPQLIFHNATPYVPGQ